MDLRRLEYFLAVVRHGRVTSAALELHVAQPSLSQAIRSLERDLGVQLFHRDGRGLTPTAAGLALVEPARQVLRDLAEARAAVDDVIDLSAGWLDVAAPDLLSVHPLAGVLTAFHRRHARVPVRLHEPQDDEELVRMVAEGRCELAVTYISGRISDQLAGLRLVPLGTHEIWVLLPPDTEQWPDPLPLTALAGRPVVVSLSGVGAPRAAVGSAQRAAGVELHPVVLTRHREAIVPMVRAGVGLTFTHRAYAERATADGVVSRPLDPPITCDFALLHRDSTLSPAARGFVAVMAEELGSPQLTAIDS